MSLKRKVEVFSAGCAFCNEVVDAVRREAGPSCEVIVQSTLDSRVLARAEQLGIRSVPAVVIDGKLADPCTASDVVELLKNAGLGESLRGFVGVRSTAENLSTVHHRDRDCPADCDANASRPKE
jgi:glutaredoxin 3